MMILGWICLDEIVNWQSNIEFYEYILKLFLSKLIQTFVLIGKNLSFQSIYSYILYEFYCAWISGMCSDARSK